MKENIFIIGSGDSSPLNIQANLEDYFATAKRKKKDLTVVIPFHGKPTAGQVLAHQYAASEGIDTLIITNDGGEVFQFSSASIDYTEEYPVTQVAGNLMADVESKIFMLFDDEDPECNIYLQIAQHHTVAVFDLCQGLFPIDPVAVITPVLTPIIPEAEKLPVKAVEDDLEASEEDEEDEDLEEYDEEDEMLMDTLYEAIAAIARKAAQQAILDIKPKRGKK